MEHVRKRHLGLAALCMAALALLLCAAVMPKPALADESTAYAVYDSTTQTLTFTHDSTAHADGSTGASTDVPSLSGTWFVVGNGANVTWKYGASNSIVNSVQHVVFDDTCASDKIAPTSMNDWFYYMTNLADIQNIERLDTSNVTNMTQTFDRCYALTSLDVSHFDTSKVTSLWNTFCYCLKLTSLDVSGWDTSNVTNMNSTFYDCARVWALDVSGWDTHNVTDMNNMFLGCGKVTTLDVSNWDTSNVVEMQSTFSNCHALASIQGIGQLDTQNVQKMNHLFNGSESLTSLDLSHWRTPKVDNMNSMFAGCSGLQTLDISGFDNSKVTNMQDMFNVLKDTGRPATDLALKTVAVGANWTWKGAATDSSKYALLPDAPTGDAGSGNAYTGKWADVAGPLSSADPLAADQLTASELQTSDPYEGNTHVLTWGEEATADYTLHYDANGGEGAPADDVVSVAPSQAVSSSWTVSSTVPTHTGYTFKEWNTKADGTGTSYDASATVALPTGSERSVTLYAIWQHNAASTLAYDANGGEGTVDSVTGTPGWRVVVAYGGFTRAGYTFKEWNTKADGTGISYDGGSFFTLPADGETATLYAQWDENPVTYTLHYAANAGSATVSNLPADQTVTTTPTEAAHKHWEVSSTAPTRDDHYRFSTWTANQDGSGEQFGGTHSNYIDLPTDGSTSVTIYAQWDKETEFTLNFDGNGNGDTVTNVPASQSGWAVLGDVHPEYGEEWQIPFDTESRPVRAGYTFKNWNTKADGTGTKYDPGDGVYFPEDGTTSVTLYAQWNENKADYTLHYDANGGTGAPADDVKSVFPTQSQKPENAWTVSSTTPTRAGYTFKEWNTKANGTGDSYEPNAQLTLPAGSEHTTTLYAQWQRQTSTLAYDANGGQGSMDPATGGTGDEVTVAENGFTRDGYAFAGWNTKADGTGESYAPGDEVALPEEDGATTTLYAQWTKKPADVTPPEDQGGTDPGNNPGTPENPGNSDRAPSGEEPEGQSSEEGSAAEQATDATPQTGDSALPIAGAVALGSAAAAGVWAARRKGDQQ